MQSAVRYKSETYDNVVSFVAEMKENEIEALHSCSRAVISRIRAEVEKHE